MIDWEQPPTERANRQTDRERGDRSVRSGDLGGRPHLVRHHGVTSIGPKSQVIALDSCPATTPEVASKRVPTTQALGPRFFERAQSSAPAGSTKRRRSRGPAADIATR